MLGPRDRHSQARPGCGVDPALLLAGVSRTFVSAGDSGRRYTAVSDATLQVGAGEFVSVVGPTGCGKSTLLNVAAGLLAPSTGRVQVFGQPLQGINACASYMFQTESLMPWRTALGNVMAGLEFRGVADVRARGMRKRTSVVLANARMLGASSRQLLRLVYLPGAMSWVFSSLHTSVGLAFVGAVVGEYLGSSQGVGYLILQAEGIFDINTVMAGILVLTVFALVLDAVVGRVERRLMKWQPRAGETEKL